MKKVLITGASGLIGTRLSDILISAGYGVNVLGRSGKLSGSGGEKQDGNRCYFIWNIEKGEVEPEAFEGVTTIIHLAGAGVAEGRWSDKRKKEIIDSRVKTAKLLFDFLKTGNHEVKTFISAGGVGYYGDCGEEVIREGKLPGKGFLAEVCKQWESGAIQYSQLGIREVRCRIGIVLSKNGGALPELMRTLPIGIAPHFAKQNLYYPWIHIDDVCGIMIHAMVNEKVAGPYNLTAPQPLLMKDLMKEIIRAEKSKAVLVPVPPLALRISMGEMSEMLLCSQRCSADKILKSGYKFRFGTIEESLRALFL